MAAASNNRALSRVQDEQEVEIVDGPRHVLVLGDQEFVGKEGSPTGTLLRYADNDLLGLHHVLTKLVLPDEPSDAELRANPFAKPSLDRMWDAIEELDDAETMEAVKDFVSSYFDRPTQSPSSSRGGHKRTGRR